MAEPLQPLGGRPPRPDRSRGAAPARRAGVSDDAAVGSLRPAARAFADASSDRRGPAASRPVPSRPESSLPESSRPGSSRPGSSRPVSSRPGSSESRSSRPGSSGLRSSEPGSPAARLRAGHLPAVKVCGLTRPGDVSLAVAAGADAIGLVHHAPSPRHLTLDAARALALAARGRALRVLVVVDRAPDALAALAVAVGVDAVQLCGAEAPDDFVGFPLPVLRRVAVEAAGAAELERWRAVAAGFVLDAPDAPGGTGRPVDAPLAADLARRAPCLLAGGLEAGNVAALVARVRPAGVDASSRLERAPGRKDAALLGEFVHAARLALAANPAGRRLTGSHGPGLDRPLPPTVGADPRPDRPRTR